MNSAFQEALAARLLWIDVVAFESIEGCEALTETALQASYDAVHALASNDVLTYRHYGPRAPLLLHDVPELAEQYNLAHEVYTELYFTNYHNGSLGELSASWLPPAAPLDKPFSRWSAEVTALLADLMELPCSRVSDATTGQAKTLLLAWSRGMDALEAAGGVYAAFLEDEAYREWERQIEEENEHRAYMADLADTYDSIEADLWRGWRSEFEDDERLAAAGLTNE